MNVQILIFIGLAELDWWRSRGDKSVMTEFKQTYMGQLKRKLTISSVFFFSLLFCFLWTMLLVSIYQSLSVGSRSTCRAFAYLNVIDLFWKLRLVCHLRCFSPDCSRLIIPGGFGSRDCRLTFYPHSLPAWHFATLIKTVPQRKDINHLCLVCEKVCPFFCQCAGLLLTLGFSVTTKHHNLNLI